jgi:hypothetical protein
VTIRFARLGTVALDFDQRICDHVDPDGREAQRIVAYLGEMTRGDGAGSAKQRSSAEARGLHAEAASLAWPPLFRRRPRLPARVRPVLVGRDLLSDDPEEPVGAAIAQELELFPEILDGRLEVVVRP